MGGLIMEGWGWVVIWVIVEDAELLADSNGTIE